MFEGHICPKFSHGNWIDGCIEHVKVFYPFLGMDNTEKIKTLTPEFRKVSKDFKGDGYRVCNTTNGAHIGLKRDVTEDKKI